MAGKSRDAIDLIGFLMVAILLVILGRDLLPFSALLTWGMTFGTATAVGILLVSLYRVQVELKASRHELARKDAELNVAREVQRALFPRELPSRDGLRFSATCIPAERIGGDYYDMLKRKDGRILFTIADISGKGLFAALLMANLQALFRVLFSETRSVARSCEMLNEHLHQVTEAAKFATFFVAEWNPLTRTLCYVNAGHEPPILINCGGGGSLTTGGPPLGLFPSVRYQSGQVELADFDLLVLFSDGISEARRNDDDEFGSERLRRELEAIRHHPLGEIQRRILNAVRNWSGDETDDDMTLVVIRVTGRDLEPPADREVATGDVPSGEGV